MICQRMNTSILILCGTIINNITDVIRHGLVNAILLYSTMENLIEDSNFASFSFQSDQIVMWTTT